MNSSEIISEQIQHAVSPGYNLNFKTVFLVVILICACCLLSIGYNFDISKLFESGTSMVACGVLVAFLFYVLYEFFKSDTCEDLKQSGWNRLKSSANIGTNYLGEQVNRSFMNNRPQYIGLNPSSNPVLNPSLIPSLNTGSIPNLNPSLIPNSIPAQYPA